MCINHYEYAKGPSRTIRKVGHEDIDMDIDPGATGVQTYTANNPQAFMWDNLFEQGVQQSTQGTSSSKDQIQTFTTTIFTPGIDTRPQALAVKGVADNLLGATGAVLGGTAGLLTGRPALVYTGVTLGDAAGRALGDVMYSAAHWWWDPHPFAASDRSNRRVKELGFGLAY